MITKIHEIASRKKEKTNEKKNVRNTKATLDRINAQLRFSASLTLLSDLTLSPTRNKIYVHIF